ncbi:hypothetical protein GW17_00062447 [Ensete ventricosum]|nr:hypothetical protein GW17_00062447 [Ensete ventricosum]
MEHRRGSWRRCRPRRGRRRIESTGLGPQYISSKWKRTILTSRLTESFDKWASLGFIPKGKVVEDSWDTNVALEEDAGEEETVEGCSVGFESTEVTEEHAGLTEEDGDMGSGAAAEGEGRRPSRRERTEEGEKARTAREQRARLRWEVGGGTADWVRADSRIQPLNSVCFSWESDWINGIGNQQGREERSKDRSFIASVDLVLLLSSDPLVSGPRTAMASIPCSIYLYPSSSLGTTSSSSSSSSSVARRSVERLWSPFLAIRRSLGWLMASRLRAKVGPRDAGSGTTTGVDAESTGIYGSQSRDDFSRYDVEQVTPRE